MMHGWRIRRVLEAAALGMAAGMLLGLLEGATARALAGESTADRILGLALLDGCLLSWIGGLAGLVRTVVRPPVGPAPRWRVIAAATRSRPPSGPASRWRVVAAAALLAGAYGLVAHREARALRIVGEELTQSWRLEQPIPRLHLAPDDPGPGPVILISLDTVRGDVLTPAFMPSIARRAASGLLFPSARTPHPWTLPAMATVLTGQYYPRHGAALPSPDFRTQGRTPIAASIPTLAEQLQDRGFINAAVTTNPFMSVRFGFTRGFDRFDDMSRRGLLLYGLRRSRLLRPLLPEGSDAARIVTDRALEDLDRLAGGRFFLWLHYLDAHTPYLAEPDIAEPFGVCDMPDCFHHWGRVRTGALSLEPAEKQRVRALYDNDLRYLDRELERFLRGVADRGLLERALVILVGDHGEEFWEHPNSVEHGGDFYEGVVHVPLVVWAPGRAAVRVEHAVDLSAIAPAVLAWTAGQGLGPLEPGQPDMRTPLSSLLFEPKGTGCTDGRFKAIATAGRPPALYDLAVDPEERTDIASARPEELERLRACIPPPEGPPPGPARRIDSPELRALGYVQP